MKSGKVFAEMREPFFFYYRKAPLGSANLFTPFVTFGDSYFGGKLSY